MEKSNKAARSMKLANSNSNVLKNNQKAKVLKARGQLLQENGLHDHSVLNSFTGFCQGQQCAFVPCVVDFAAIVVILHTSVIVRGFIGLFFQASCVL